MLRCSDAVDLEHAVVVDQCGSCMGLIFDPNETQHLIKQSSKSVHEIYLQRLTVLNENGLIENQRKKHYIPCPVCKQLMNQFNYGKLSGVVVDWCKEDGVWLDGGELRKLLDWGRSGGHLLDAEDRARKEEAARAEPIPKWTIVDNATMCIGEDHDGPDLIGGVLGGLLKLLLK